MTDAPQQLAPKAQPGDWVALSIIVLACVLVAMDISVLFYAVPFLTVDLAPSSSQLLWIMDIYGFLLAGFLITMGSLGDRVGRRLVLLVGAATFGAASLLAAFSTSAEMLIASRALLGIAAATVAPSTLSLIRNIFHDPGQRRSAIALWTAGFAAGALIGPIVAGGLLEYFWWGSVFLINVPVMVVLLALGPKLLPEFRSPGASRFDLVGAVLSLAAVLPIVYGGKKLAEQGVTPTALLAIIVGLVFGFLFIRSQRKYADPLIDMNLFRSRRFSVAITTNTVLQFAMLGLLMITSQYFLVILDISPFVASLWRLPAVATLFVGLALGGIIARRVRPATITGLGLGIAAIGFTTVSFATPQAGLPVIVVGSSVMTIGVGMVVVLATDIVLATAPPERAGSAAALSETSNEFGGALGIAVLGSVTTAVYRSAISDGVPTDLHAELRDKVLNTVAEAEDVARNVLGPAGGELLAAAEQAFTAGVQWSALLGATVLAVVGVLAAGLLRGLRLSSPSQEDRPDEHHNKIPSTRDPSDVHVADET